MNKNTTDITLSAYFNDIVIGYYEDEDLVKQFGRQLGFDVDMDTFMAVSFQYPSDMNVKPEDREKLTDAANAIIALSDINRKIGGKQIITCDSGDCVILIMKDKSAMRELIPQSLTTTTCGLSFSLILIEWVPSPRPTIIRLFSLPFPGSSKYPAQRG